MSDSGDSGRFSVCSCNHCGQRLEFPSDGAGSEIRCPTCGKMTRLSVVKPIPVAPPASSGPPVTREKGKSWVPIVVTVIVTTVVLLGVGLPSIYVWQKRAQEAQQIRQKTEQLKTELQLLEAQMQTGMSYNDFLAQVARVRAAHLAARETLNESQELEFRKLDACFDLCALIWNPQQPGNQSSGSEDYVSYDVTARDKYAKLFTTVGIEGQLQWFGYPEERGFEYNIHACVQRILPRITEDIEAFLNNHRCPWPK